MGRWVSPVPILARTLAANSHKECSLFGSLKPDRRMESCFAPYLHNLIINHGLAVFRVMSTWWGTSRLRMNLHLSFLFSSGLSLKPLLFSTNMFLAILAVFYNNKILFSINLVVDFHTFFSSVCILKTDLQSWILFVIFIVFCNLNCPLQPC